MNCVLPLALLILIACLQLGCASKSTESVRGGKPSSLQAKDAAKIHPFKVVDGQDDSDLLKHYIKVSTSRVGVRWQQLIYSHRDELEFGKVRYRFYIDKNGSPDRIALISGKYSLLSKLTKRAISETLFPPIPDKLLSTLTEERVKIEYEAIVY